MKQSDVKNAPWLGGWVIAAAAGLVAGGVVSVVGNFSVSQAGFTALCVALATGLFIAMPWAAGGSRPKAMAAAPMPAAAPVTKAAVLSVVPATPAMADAGLVAGPVATAFVAAPPADAALATPSLATPARAPLSQNVVAANLAAEPAFVKAPRARNADGPARLSAPRHGKADDLKEIEGVGPALEKLCNVLGFYHFDQIAGWSADDVDWVDANMKTFKGRIVRDKWIAQCKIITTDGLEAFRLRAKINDY